jgi:hypothetical protein
MSLPVGFAASQPGQGFSAEYWAGLAVERIIHVAEDAAVPEVVKQQALAFQAQIRGVVAHYIQHATNERRAISATAADNAGRSDIAEAIRAAP